MPDPKLDLLLTRRPLRLSVGLLAGLFFGPFITLLLAFAPSSELLGPYVVDGAIIALMIWGWCGPVVGIAVALFALGIQRLKWRWSGSSSDAWYSEPEGAPNQSDRGINGDGCITRRTNIADSMD